MSIHSRRLLLLSSSALMVLCVAGAASSQTPPTPPETPQTTTPPAAEAPAPQPPQTTPETPQATPATPQTVPSAGPTVPVPEVTVEAPRARPARRSTPAAPGPSRSPAAAAAPNPNSDADAHGPASRDLAVPACAVAERRRQQPNSSEPGPEFRQLVLHPARRHLEPGSRRARPARCCAGSTISAFALQENGIGSMDVSDLGQDHGVPIDPLSIQRSRSSAARRRCATVAGGRRHRGRDQQPHSDRCAAGRLANANPGSHDHG